MTSDTEWLDSMIAVLLAGHGGFDKRVVHDDVPLLRPVAGEALVRVDAATVTISAATPAWAGTRSVLRARPTAWRTTPASRTAAGAARSLSRAQGADLCAAVAVLGDDGEGIPRGARFTCATNQPIPTDDAPVRFRAIGSDSGGAFAQYSTVRADQLFDVIPAPHRRRGRGTAMRLRHGAEPAPAVAASATATKSWWPRRSGPRSRPRFTSWVGRADRA